MERFILKVCVISIFSFFFTSGYAIEIKVKTTAEHITGLGFTVDGKQHGGMGKSYEAKNMPEGMYSFGLRHGTKDVSCPDKDGAQQIKIMKDTTANLVYDGGKCALEIES